MLHIVAVSIYEHDKEAEVATLLSCGADTTPCCHQGVVSALHDNSVATIITDGTTSCQSLGEDGDDSTLAMILLRSGGR